MEDSDPFWSKIDKFRKTSAGASYGVYIPLSSLIPATKEKGGLSVRVITKARRQAKIESLHEGYAPNCPFTVRDNEDGTYTILDGNHRYEAILFLIHRMEKHGTPCIYNMEFKIPCQVYRIDIPLDMAMSYCTLVNDLQLCAAGGNALDTLRFIQNMITQLTDG